MMKLNTTRKPAMNPLGALRFRNLSQPKDTRYDEAPAAMAGNSHIFSAKITRPAYHAESFPERLSRISDCGLRIAD